MQGPDADEWLEAIVSEVKSLLKNDTWSVVKRPKDREVIGCRFVLRNKHNSDGTLERRKARLVAKGYAQRPGIDFCDTFAPVARMSSIRAVSALAAQFGLTLYHFDVTTAYLNGELEEDVFMKIPENIEDSLEEIVRSGRKDCKIQKKAKKMLESLANEDNALLLRKSLYGLRQAGRRWHVKLCKILKEFGFSQSISDPCVFYLGKGEDILLAVVYVDDIIAVSKTEQAVANLLQHLSTQLDIKNLGPVKHCLGIEFSQTKEIITLNQRGYVNDILERFRMSGSNPVGTPVELGTKLRRNEEIAPECKTLPYRELVGALMYLATCTRPDIAHVVSYLSKFNDCFSTDHWLAAKRVLRYLKGTCDVGLSFRRSTDPLIGFADADWANCVDDRKSYTGYAFILGGCPISWESRKQKTTALSSMEAEYMALSEATKEAVHLQRFFGELGFPYPKIKLFSDNCGAIKLAENPVFHNRSKHIDVRHHFIRGMLENGVIEVDYRSTEDMAADVLTKGLSGPKHRRCLELMGISTGEKYSRDHSRLEGKC